MLVEALAFKGAVVLVKVLGAKTVLVAKSVWAANGLAGVVGVCTATGITVMVLTRVESLTRALERRDLPTALSAATGLLADVKGIPAMESYTDTLAQFVHERGANLGTWERLIRGAKEITRALRTAR